MSGSHDYPDRLHELLAAQQLGDLSHEERDGLETIIQEHADLPEEILGELLVMLDRASPNEDDLPADLAQRLTAGGRAAIASSAGHAPLKFSPDSNSSDS